MINNKLQNKIYHRLQLYNIRYKYTIDTNTRHTMEQRARNNNSRSAILEAVY